VFRGLFFFNIQQNDFLLFIATYHRWPIPSTGQSQCVPPFRSGNYIFPSAARCLSKNAPTFAGYGFDKHRL